MMLPTLILALNLLLLVAGDNSAGLGDYPYQLSPLRPPTPGTGTVQGFRQCGGDGKILDWRNSACSGYHELPGQGATTTLCTIPTGTVLQHEIDYRAGRTTSQLRIKFFLFTHGNFSQVIEQVVDNGAVIAGHEYTLHRLWTLPPAFSGQTISFKGILSREDEAVEDETEFCGLVHYKGQ